MLTIERELTAVIYVFYAMDCTHWLKAGETAYTRRLWGAWRKWEHREDGFTLLGRAPVFVNPFDLRPGWIMSRAPAARLVSEQSIRRFLKKEMPRQTALTAVAALAGLNALVLVPALLITGLLGALWEVPVAILLATQIGVAVEFYVQAGDWRNSGRESFWREYIPLLLNPVAALRAGDVLCRGLFDQKDMSVGN